MSMNYVPVLSPDDTHVETNQPRVGRRTWRAKFGDALRGIKLGIRGHSSFFVHFFFTALVLAAAVVMHCSVIDWCLLLGCIGAVLMAELFNSAVETICRSFDESQRVRLRPALDIAAGAVLVASVSAAVVGTLVFLHSLGF